MTSFADFSPVLVEGLCAWNALRRLGFSADDLYLAVAPGVGACDVYMNVRKQHSLRIGSMDKPADDIFAEWQRLGDAWANGCLSTDEFLCIFDRSQTSARAGELVTGLVAVGLKPWTEEVSL